MTNDEIAIKWAIILLAMFEGESAHAMRERIERGKKTRRSHLVVALNGRSYFMPRAEFVHYAKLTLEYAS